MCSRFSFYFLQSRFVLCPWFLLIIIHLGTISYVYPIRDSFNFLDFCVIMFFILKLNLEKFWLSFLKLSFKLFSISFSWDFHYTYVDVLNIVPHFLSVFSFWSVWTHLFPHSLILQFDTLNMLWSSIKQLSIALYLWAFTLGLPVRFLLL